MKYIVNSFTQKMLDTKNHLFKIEKSNKNEVMKDKKECISAIGHCGIGKFLGTKVHRMNIQLEKGDICYIVSTNNNRKKSWYPNIENKQYVYQKLTVVE